MKSAIYFSAIVSLTLISTAHAQETCATGGGHPGGVAPGLGAINPSDPFIFPSNGQPVPNASTRPSAPQARITVVDSASESDSSARSAKQSAPTARLTVVDDLPRQRPVANVAAEDASVNEVIRAVAIETTSSAESENATISDALKGLVGTWKAVARRGDGELTTVELRLDDRGWAELTVPDAEGKPSTIKRRAELDGQDLKLTGPDAELLLGQVIEANSRQMVLARAGGQVTFVRP